MFLINLYDASSGSFLCRCTFDGWQPLRQFLLRSARGGLMEDVHAVALYRRGESWESLEDG